MGLNYYKLFVIISVIISFYKVDNYETELILMVIYDTLFIQYKIVLKKLRVGDFNYILLFLYYCFNHFIFLI